MNSMLRLARISVLLSVVSPAVAQAQGGYTRSRRGAGGAASKLPPAYKDVAGSFHGKLKDLSDKEIMIVNDDDQIVTVRRSRKTKFLKDGKAIKAADIDIETPVTIDASEDTDLKLTAVSVTVDPPQKSKAESK